MYDDDTPQWLTQNWSNKTFKHNVAVLFPTLLKYTKQIFGSNVHKEQKQKKTVLRTHLLGGLANSGWVGFKALTKAVRIPAKK